MGDDFAEVLPRLEAGEVVAPIEYAKSVRVDSPVASSVRGRDIEMQLLFTCYLVARRSGEQRIQEEVSESRVRIRRNFTGEWTDDNTAFREDEIRGMRASMARMGLIQLAPEEGEN